MPVDGFAESEVLRLAASLELASEHPLAAAIVAARASEGWRCVEPQGFQSVTGQGVAGLSTAARLRSATWRCSRERGSMRRACAPKADGLRREARP